MKISNIWAVGRNYSEHAKELGNQVPTEPLIFLKAGSSVVLESTPIELPFFSKDVHHELEIAYQFDENLKLSKIGLAIDFTARDIQATLKAKSLPWTLAKSFKHSCALSQLVNVPSDKSLKFELKVNGDLRQTGCSDDMIFTPAYLAEYLCARFPVVPGDIMLTGTPAGVSAVKAGDLIEATLLGHLKASWQVKKH